MRLYIISTRQPDNIESLKLLPLFNPFIEEVPCEENMASSSTSNYESARLSSDDSKVHENNESMARLLQLKGKLSDNLIQLKNRKQQLSHELIEIKNLKKQKREEENQAMVEQYGLKIDIEAAKKQVATNDSYFKTVIGIIDNFENHLATEVGLNEFEPKIMNLIENVQGAMNIHQEESLQLELMRRNQSVKEKRVELTDLETTINEVQQRIEFRQLELERLKAEEEAKRKHEENLKREHERAQERLQLRKQLQIKTNGNPTLVNLASITNGTTSNNTWETNRKLDPFRPNHSTPKSTFDKTNMGLIQDSIKEWGGLLSW